MPKLIKQMLGYPGKFLRGKFAKAPGSIDDVNPGEGAILEIEGRKVAVYKNSDGSILKLSPTCTHMGCTISWDSENGRWTCPCHESHFTKEGKVIDGPAKRDLQQIKR